MREVLANRDYRRLFTAQMVALVGTGLLTVALGLLAYDIAGGDAGVVLGTALTIKMVAYVVVAPVVSAVSSRVPPKRLLISADLVRGVIAAGLPFVTEVWQVYVLIFVLQSASATFTPAFQSVIPEILPDERQYTRALSLSRLAYDLESLTSPAIAAALLTVVTYSSLFAGTAAGFAVSAVLVALTVLPARRPVSTTAFWERLTRGVRVFWHTGELRALLALNLVVATGTAMVIVNTVVYVRVVLERPEADVAVLLAAYGAGSMLVALVLPRILDRMSDRPVMLTGGVLIPLAMTALASVTNSDLESSWAWAMAVWLLLGAATSLILTPSARLLRRASTEENRPAVFAAQFSLSHACFMLTYPLAGTLGARLGLPVTALILVAIGAVAAVASFISYRSRARSATSDRS